MSRVPRLTCADCGKGMKRSPSSKPQGEARCHPCRRIRPARADNRYAHVCQECGKLFTAQQKDRKFCNLDCFGAHDGKRRTIRHPDDTRARRGARENAAPGLTKSARDKLRAKWQRQGKPCAYCGSRADTIDHVLPLVRGGTNYEGNLVPACRRCNSSKSGKTIVEWRHGVSLGKVQEAPDWLGRAPAQRTRKPKPEPQPKPCDICGHPTLKRKRCSERCETEHFRRYMRDRYRSRRGLPVDPSRPTSKWAA